MIRAQTANGLNEYEVLRRLRRFRHSSNHRHVDIIEHSASARVFGVFIQNSAAVRLVRGVSVAYPSREREWPLARFEVSKRRLCALTSLS